MPTSCISLYVYFILSALTTAEIIEEKTGGDKGGNTFGNYEQWNKNRYNITKIVCSGKNRLDYLSIEYGDINDSYGTKTSPSTYTLSSDEVITRVDVWTTDKNSITYVKGVMMISNNGKLIHCGIPNPTDNFDEYKSMSETRLLYVSGRAGLYFDSLTFYWYTHIDDCASNPCKNGGLCEDLDDAFQCNCTTGYYGTSCEINRDDCENIVCENNGTCTDGTNDFTCLCPNGFTGSKCDTDVNECMSSPCVNGGTCVDLNNAFKCNCTAGYTGTICEINRNDCEMVKCRNNGTCIDGLNDFICLCTKGFTGRYCDTGINQLCVECQSIQNDTTINASILKEKLGNITKTLMVDKGNLTGNRRKKISAPDDRVSSKITGFAIGVGILTVAASCIIVPDLVQVLNAWKKCRPQERVG